MKRNSFLFFFILILYCTTSCESQKDIIPDRLVGMSEEELLQYVKSDYYETQCNLNSDEVYSHYSVNSSRNSNVIVFQVSPATKRVVKYYHTRYLDLNEIKKYIGTNLDVIKTRFGLPFVVRKNISKEEGAFLMVYFQKEWNIKKFSFAISSYVICLYFDEHEVLTKVEEVYWSHP